MKVEHLEDAAILLKNLGNDYTPAITGSVLAGAPTGVVYNTAQWVRLGRLCVAEFANAFTGHSGNGEMRIQLPFVAANAYPSTDAVQAVEVYVDGVTYPGASVLIKPNEAYMRLKLAGYFPPFRVENVGSGVAMSITVKFFTDEP